MTAFSEGAGLQPERTALAWQRTAVTATIVMVPLVLVNARLGSWLMTALVSASATTAGVLVVRVRRRFAQLRGEHRPFSPFDPMVVVATVTGLAAGVGTLTALVLALS